MTNSASVCTLSLFLAMTLPVVAQHRYAIELPERDEPVVRDQLDLGGTNPRGEAIAVNSNYLERSGKPFFPIVGEFHYSRFPADEWDAAIRKVKAGGINVIATYVFWNLHERQEGRFDWSGDLDLRRFIELCAKSDIFVLVRLGPFCHGEMRNGGLPDWLYGRPFEVRSNDPGYLAYVDKLYAEIGRQLRGLLYSDGGPVIGVQLENEFQHSAAPWELAYPGSAREFTVAERDVAVTHGGVSVSTVENPYAAYGQDHMVTLKKLAKKQGIDVPLYTATGWGNAAIVPRGSIPVTAGYAYPFWAPLDPTPFYLYKDIRAYPDYAPVSYDTSLYPSLPAELGAGIMPTYARRPRVPPESILPLIVRTIGSGSNGIGYYMYHGGTTPVFGHFYGEESGGLPKVNYDYQAPIGEYGQLRPHYHQLNLIHLFLESYAGILAPMPVVLPVTNAAISPSDTSTLRYAVRSAGGAGFVFMHNFQDHVALQDIEDVRVEVSGRSGSFTFPRKGTFTLPAGASAVLPFGLPFGSNQLESATVQPLTILRQEGVTHRIFFSIPGLPPELVFRGAPRVQPQNCQVEIAGDVTIVRGPEEAAFAFDVDGERFLIVPRSLALGAFKVDAGHLWFADASFARADGVVDLVVSGRESVLVHAYPASAAPAGASHAKISEARSRHSSLSAFAIDFERRDPGFSVAKVGARKLVIRSSGGASDLQDVWMRVPYVGDRGMAFIDGQLVADHLYYGEPWEIGLKRFAPWTAQREMVIVFHPMRRDQTFLQDLDPEVRPAFSTDKETHLEVGEITFVPVYRTAIAAP